MNEKKRIKYIAPRKAKELTDIWDMIREAQKLALKEGIKANSIVINKKFIKVPSVWLNIVGTPIQFPPMICGLECYFTDNDFPDNYSFALLEKPQTERELLIEKTKSDTAKEILNKIRRLFPTAERCDFGDLYLIDKIKKIAEEYGVELDEKWFKSEGIPEITE